MARILHPTVGIVDSTTTLDFDAGEIGVMNCSDDADLISPKSSASPDP